MSGENTKITLDSPEFLEKKQRLSSPRSIEACRLIGITPNELYPITLDEYINKHPDIKYMKQNLQEQRFNNFDKIRKENLEAAQSKRKEIIENEGNKSNQSKSQNKMDNSTAVKILSPSSNPLIFLPISTIPNLIVSLTKGGRQSFILENTIPGL